MRTLIFVTNKQYKPKDRSNLLEKLRKHMDARGIRIARNHMEVEVWNIDPLEAKQTIESIIGEEVVMMDSIDNIERRLKVSSLNDAIPLFIQLFNEERYWEAHVVLENIWQKNKNSYIQSLILLAASHIKIQEDKPEYAIKIARESLKIMADNTRIGCIDLRDLQHDVKIYIATLKPIKFKCHYTS